MHLHAKALVVALCIVSASVAHATDSIAMQFSIGRGVGEVRVRYEPIEVIQGGTSDGRYSRGFLRFRWAGSTAQLQSIQSMVMLYEPKFEIWDVNGDGFNDVVFYNQYAGYGGAPTRGAHVLIYAPQLKRFVPSVTLSDRGELSPAKARGCVLVEFKSGPTGYTTEERCFNLRKGLWTLVRSEGGEAE